jgi:hypothetical protein
VTGRALARLVGLLALWHAINILERVAYAAGVDDGAGVVATVRRPAAEDQADELEPADCSDVVEAHADCCGVPA